MRTSDAKQIIAISPCTSSEFAIISGWPTKRAQRVLEHLTKKGAVSMVNLGGKRLKYQLTPFGLSTLKH